MNTNMLLKYAAIVMLGAAASMAENTSVSAGQSAADALKAIDTGNDGTINLTEAKFAAAAVIVKIDGDHNGVLNNDELGGRATAMDQLTQTGNRFMFWKTKGTITKEDYLALVESRFTRASPDDDGTLDAKELETDDGRALLKLLQ